MDTATRPSPIDADSPYRQCLAALTDEIEEAMGAIASDDLPRFTESVARQEIMASSLTSFRKALSQTSVPITPDASVRVAERELQLVNLQFAVLLKHLSRTTAMLSALCNSHTGEISGQIQEASRTRSKHQTWFCEM